jgi:hypothetical protein
VTRPWWRLSLLSVALLPAITLTSARTAIYHEQSCFSYLAVSALSFFRRLSLFSGLGTKGKHYSATEAFTVPWSCFYLFIIARSRPVPYFRSLSFKQTESYVNCARERKRKTRRSFTSAVSSAAFGFHHHMHQIGNIHGFRPR